MKNNEKNNENVNILDNILKSLNIELSCSELSNEQIDAIVNDILNEKQLMLAILSIACKGFLNHGEKVFIMGKIINHLNNEQKDLLTERINSRIEAGKDTEYCGPTRNEVEGKGFHL